MAATLWASEDEAVWESHLDSIEQKRRAAINFTAPSRATPARRLAVQIPHPLDSPRRREMDSLVDFPHTTGSA